MAPSACDERRHPATGSKRSWRTGCRWYSRLISIITAAALVFAWCVGSAWEQADISEYLKQALPEAGRFEALRDNCYAARGKGSSQELLGYVRIGEASGYGGPIRLAVAIDLHGDIRGLAIVNQKETPSFFRQSLAGGVLKSMVGKSYADPFQIGRDLDGVTGATYTTRALAQAASAAATDSAAIDLGLPVAPRPSPPIVFGIPEGTLIALYTAWCIGQRLKPRLRRMLRWLSLITGLLVIGFVYNQPLTLAFVDRLALGYWPPWNTHIYFYILAGVPLLTLISVNSNPYCTWSCPFGATQDCLALLGGAGTKVPSRLATILRRCQMILFWVAIILAVLFRNPGVSSYEVFGTLFSLTGSPIQFGLLVLVLIMALFIKRPWCNYLCPIRPLEQCIRESRRWIRSHLKSLLHKASA